MDDMEPPAVMFAKGIAETVTPAIAQCDEQLKALEKSQDALMARMGELDASIAEYSAEAESLEDLKPHIARLGSVRARVTKVNNTLQAISKRVQKAESILKKKGMRLDQTAHS